jgi:transposase
MPLDAARDTVIAVQTRVIEALAAENARLAGQVADLAARVERLERLASRNSGNSSMLPSADDLPAARRRGASRLLAGSGSRASSQGAPGSHLAWTQNPDQRVDHFPAGACACGAALANGRDLGVAASHQQVEIPLASAQVIQHDLHEAACGCGRVHQAAAPPGARAPGTVTYGPNLQSWCVYLIAAHAIPVHRCAELIEALTGARPSPGFVHTMIARAAAAVAQANAAIRALIILAHVICADETPIRAGPGSKTRKRYLLVACTKLLTYYVLGDRSLATFSAFVFPDLAGVVVVHDRYQNYDAFPGIIHQLCTAHLLRDLADAAETYPRSGLARSPVRCAG